MDATGLGADMSVHDLVACAQPDGELNSLSKALSFYSVDGWRVRLGFIAPATNTTLASECAPMAPHGIAAFVRRVYQAGRQVPPFYERMADDIETASKPIATTEPDVIAFGCTSRTDFIQPDTVKTTLRLTTGCPAILTADAVVEAMRAMKLKRITLIGPRIEFVAIREIQFLQEAGFDVVASRCLDLGQKQKERRAVRRVPPQSLYCLVLSFDVPDIEAIFVSCAQLPTVTLIDRLKNARQARHHE